MNPTWCPICNDLLAKRRDAFIRSEWDKFEWLQNDLENHQAKCHEIHDALYLMLWKNVQVVPVKEGV